jgi:hypothetical protein
VPLGPRLKIIGLRALQRHSPADHQAFPGFNAEPRAREWNLWGYIDARDSAQAVRLAGEHQANGVDIFIFANADTVISQANRELLVEVFPDVPVRGEIGEHDTLLSIEKARRVLGYQPEPQRAGRNPAFAVSRSSDRVVDVHHRPAAGMRAMLSSGLGRGGVPERATRR